MKKKILFINGHLKIGGIEKLLIDILKNLDYEKYDVELLLLEDMGEYAKEIPGNVKVRYYSLKNTYGSVFHSLMTCLLKRDWRCFLIRILIFLEFILKNKIYKVFSSLLLGRKRYDYVVSMRFGYSIKLAAYGVRANKRILWWNHGDIGRENVLNLSCDLKKFSKIIAVSDMVTTYLCEQFNDISDRIVTINNGVDITYIQKKAKEFYPYKNDERKFIICSVGRINPEKRYELAVYIAKKMNEELTGIDFSWYIIGDGTDFNKIRNLVVKFHLENCLFLLGAKENPYPYIANADVFVHTSYVESFGISIIEAMALRIPCIVTESRGPRSYMKNGVNGFLVKADVDIIINAIKQIKKNSKLKADIIKNGYSTALRFGIENEIEQLEQQVWGEDNEKKTY